MTPNSRDGRKLTALVAAKAVRASYCPAISVNFPEADFVEVENRLLCCKQKRDEDLAATSQRSVFHPRSTRILVLLARTVLEGTHLFQTGTHTDVVRVLRDSLAQDVDCG